MIRRVGVKIPRVVGRNEQVAMNDFDAPMYCTLIEVEPAMLPSFFYK